jgi:carbon-monoxide dehydrogenase medium subunit
MTLPKFEVLHPNSIAEACQMLEAHSTEGSAILAGGTDILVNIRRPVIPVHLPRCQGCDPQTGKPSTPLENPPKFLIALSRVKELYGIFEDEQGWIRIGSLTTIAEICKSPLIRSKLCALAEGADNLGSPLVRNRGTIGGNICNARPAGDLLVPSYALSAQLELVSVNGSRTVPVEEFVVGPGKTIIKTGELLKCIFYPPLRRNSSSSSLKLANRKALEISLVNVASVLTLNESKDKIEFARIALGAVAPTPISAIKTAEFLIGKSPNSMNFSRAGEIAVSECQPITDHRASALYRMDVVKILVSRILRRAFNSIK